MAGIEPIPLKAGDPRVIVNGKPVGVDFRIIAESKYQKLMAAISEQSDREIAIGEHAFKAGFEVAERNERRKMMDVKTVYQAWSEYTPPEHLTGGGK